MKRVVNERFAEQRNHESGVEWGDGGKGRRRTNKRFSFNLDTHNKYMRCDANVDYCVKIFGIRKYSQKKGQGKERKKGSGG